ncbi:MAG: asparaginase [Chloroflexota bacterium]|nr:MAG: L-asparaginase [Chloroflexota bacterium]
MSTTVVIARLHVSEDAFSGDVPLAAVVRGAFVGSVHRGVASVSACDGAEVLSLGDSAQSVFLRSAAKPFQVMPAILSGALDRFGVTERELAVLCASHAGEPRHVEAVSSVLTKAGLHEDDLRCGVHPPIDQESAAALVASHAGPGPVYNNCSGAHTGMLLACLANHWNIRAYGSPHHPLQRLIRGILSSFSGVPEERIEYAVDNCAVPTLRLPVNHAARAFARLAEPTDMEANLAQAARAVVCAMTNHPEMVGGRESFDSHLMLAGAKRVVAKGGADGFQGIGLPRRCLGVAIKIADGASRAVPPVSLRILRRLDLISDTEFVTLHRHARPLLHDLQGELVGHIEPLFDIETS